MTTETLHPGPGLSHLMVWERHFRQLAEYRGMHDHCHLSAGGPRGALGRWVVRQQRFSQAGLLEPQRRALLAGIGFDSGPHQERWDEMFDRLAAYERAHGDCLVSARWADNPQLAGWVRFQRALRRVGRLQAARARELEKIGFCWEPRQLAFARDPAPATQELTWDERFVQLLAFRRAYGHCQVPFAWKENLKLGMWVRIQRRARSAHSIDPENQRRLDEVGFLWNVRDRRCHNPDYDGTEEDRWERRFQQLQRFRERFGHARVPTRWTEDRRFASWVCRQRGLKKTSRLTRERQARLEAIGFAWSDPRPAAAIHEAHWVKRFSQLAKFQAAHGHCDVPEAGPLKTLARWVKMQRNKWRAGHLPPHRSERLAGLGLGPADPYLSARQRWNRHFQQLLDFCDRHGHCRVPSTWQEDPSLAAWVAAQRVLHGTHRLSAGRIARLEEIGFLWDGDEGRTADWDVEWDAMFTALAQWKEQYGTLRVTAQQHPHLSRWADTQRYMRGTGTLRADREARLDALGFPWDTSAWRTVRTTPDPAAEARWQHRLEQCVRFKKRFGHCLIPKTFPEDQGLADWVNNQRALKARGKVSAERIARLEAIGFAWQGDRLQAPGYVAAWERRYAELARFQATHGHCRPSYEDSETKCLAEWVLTQRRARRGQKLLPERQTRLDRLGFQW